jgi:hypothetical protein
MRRGDATERQGEQLDYESRQRRADAGGKPLKAEVVVGWGCLSVPFLLACLSFVFWSKRSAMVVVVMALALFVGLPSIAIGFAALPGAHRQRAVKWALLPLVAALLIIFLVGWSAQIS